jgi:hypothetical protein
MWYVSILKRFKKHKDDHKLNNEIYHCDECEKVFNEEWKLNAHKRRHKTFNCNQCSKTFKTRDIIRKNKKKCPYENECVSFMTMLVFADIV